MTIVQKDITEEEFAEFIRWKDFNQLNNRLRTIQERFNSIRPQRYSVTEFLRGLPPQVVETIHNVYNPVPHERYEPLPAGRNPEGYYEIPFDLNVDIERDEEVIVEDDDNDWLAPLTVEDEGV